MYKFGEVWCSNYGETFAHFLWCVKKLQKLTYPAVYLRRCSTDLDQIFSFDRHVEVDDKFDDCFEIFQGMLLW